MGAVGSAVRVGREGGKCGGESEELSLGVKSQLPSFWVKG